MTFKSVAITGASGGIGAALADACAAPGVTLALAGRDRLRLDRVAAGCRAKGATVAISCFDITDAAAAWAWVEDADRAHPLDLLIANAGVSSSLGPGGEPEPADAILRVFAVNTGGVLNVVSPAVERMLTRGRGRIALIGSLAGLRGMPSCPSYSASKAAVHAYGEALRGWLGPRGISVTVVCPGYVETPMSIRVAGPKPMMIPADRAARIILAAVRRGKGSVIFPAVLGVGIRMLSLLPEPLAALFLKQFHFTVHPEGHAVKEAER